MRRVSSEFGGDSSFPGEKRRDGRFPTEMSSPFFATYCASTDANAIKAAAEDSPLTKEIACEGIMQGPTFFPSHSTRQSINSSDLVQSPRFLKFPPRPPHNNSDSTHRRNAGYVIESWADADKLKDFPLLHKLLSGANSRPSAYDFHANVPTKRGYTEMIR